VIVLGSILSPLEDLMKSILDFFHSNVGLPWSWSIIALTVVVRIVLVPLTVRQIHSMQALQAHAPEMKAIQQKYKSDKAKLNEELMKFYRENHINPAASCLPLLAQFPVFIALYLTLRHAKEVSGPWLHVVPDISAKGTAHWSGYVLLAIYAGSQIASTYFMGSTMQKSQRNLMMVLPLLFITVVARFPTGLILYWMTTNLWTVGQGLVTRSLIPRTPAGKGLPPAPPQGPKRTSRTPPRDSGGNGSPPAESDGAKPKPAPSRQPRRVRRKKGGSRR
jgi:YidC/Oxa1 family membrane protein insertase